MKNIKDLSSRGVLLLAVLGLGVGVVAPAFLSSGTASAALLTSRSIELDSAQNGNTATDANGDAVTAGTGGNGAETTHNITFTTPASVTTGSFVLQYCDSPFINSTCTEPTGIDVNGDDTDVDVNVPITDFALDTTTNATTTNWFATSSNACTSGTGRTNCVLFSDASPASVTAGSFTVTLGQAGGWVKNPTTDGTYYVRIVTFSDAAYTTVVDSGTVAFSINDDIDIVSRVQEKLNFSVSSTQNVAGATCIALPANATLVLGSGALGILDAGTAYFANSYFRVSTNTAIGTTVKYTGGTLRTAASAFTITALAAETASTPGTEQFGLAIDTAATGYSNTHLDSIDADYDEGNIGTPEYNFATTSTTTPETLVSTNGPNYVTCDTIGVKYVANISPTTEPGVYRTNIGYIAVATY